MITIVRGDEADYQRLINQVYKLRARHILAAPRDNHAANDMGHVKEAADRLDTIYILVLSDVDDVIAACRLNDAGADFIEINRLDLDLDYAAKNGEMAAIDTMISKLFLGLCHLALVVGTKHAVYNYDDCFSRVVERIECHPYQVDKLALKNSRSCQRGYFSLDDSLLDKLRIRHGLDETHVDLVSIMRVTHK